MSLNNSFDNRKIEYISIKILAESVSSAYLNYQYNGSSDSFDFIDNDSHSVLEHTSCIPSESIEVLRFNKTKETNGKAKIDRLKDPIFDKSGELLSFFGDGPTTIRNKIIKAIIKKHFIALKRLTDNKEIENIELVVTILEAPYFNTMESIKDVCLEIFKHKTCFNTIYLITVNSLFCLDGKTGAVNLFVQKNFDLY